MKLPNLFALFVLCFTLCFGQGQPPKARLIDEFGDLNCEDVLARVDGFMVDLADDPASTGYAVIYPRKNMTSRGFRQENTIRGNIIFRHFDKNRLLIVRGKEGDDFNVQFWLVPAGADKPEFEMGEWSQPVKNINKAFIHFISMVDDACPGGGNVRSYTDFLAAHPDTRGHIVIFYRSRRAGQKEAASWLKTFTKDGRIKRDRFRIFLAKKTGFHDAEFWIVPVKKK